jgi:hypothetical protein
MEPETWPEFWESTAAHFEGWTKCYVSLSRQRPEDRHFPPMARHNAEAAERCRRIAAAMRGERPR